MNPNWKELDQQVTASPQIRPEDVPHIAAAGFRAIVCNRPDGEQPDQPDWATIAAACRHNGLRAEYLPMTDRTPTEAAISRLHEVMATTRGKVLLYCNSGARSERLWQAVKARRMAA
ncbi:MAG: TIGR01244 family phosphatase [Alphaproteobacteria bacterium]|nr:MAG: TIGR01244 family phosphatase [Alphaproteobacteria bacterium]